MSNLSEFFAIFKISIEFVSFLKKKNLKGKIIRLWQVIESMPPSKKLSLTSSKTTFLKGKGIALGILGIAIELLDIVVCEDERYL